MLTDAEIGIQKKDPHGSARCDRPSVQAWMRLFVTSTKLYSSHQHRISDVGTLLLQKPIVRQVDLFVETPQRFGAVRDL